ncbi:hypothetical protein [Rhodohalobacter mucosus]|uniref:Uncharacterized protein n=1 Tax=Rhodohalobacter mucosus TaxID=2079485 RepID=A0A316TYQ1_9BACT|nr:hypothetical protein [Rhodohalobacter mucosus]PWN07944.1 hypothetical protein DDZ15_02730 [Rhodohalobacter mucosus]
MNRLIPVISILLLFILQGCVVHMPASESVIWHDNQNEEETDPYGVETFLQVPVAGTSISYSAMILPQGIRDKIRRQNGDDLQPGEEIVFKNMFLPGNFMPSVAFPLTNRSALGVNINPFYPGLDGTFHLFGDNWLTTTFQFPVYNGIDFEWILQRPVIRVNHGGLSAGIFYRKERIAYYIDDDGTEAPGLFELVPNTFRSDWFGARLAGQFPDMSQTRRMKFHFHAGYNPDYRSALFMFGIGITFRPNPGPSYVDPVRYW